MHLLATVRPPTRDEASLAYRERIAPGPDELARILGGAADSGGAGDAGETIVFEIAPLEVRVVASHEDGQMDSTTVRAVRALQLATGWYVFGQLEDDFASAGQCHACSIERFDWQADEACAACGAPAIEPVAPASPASMTNDAIAESLVDAMLENEWVELVSKSSRKALVRDVASFLVRHPKCREPAGAAPVEASQGGESVVVAPVVSPASAAPAAPAREGAVYRPVPLSSLAPAARAAALADAAASTAAAVAARAARAALLAAAPKDNPGFELLDWLTDLPYVGEVYADEDTLAALLRGNVGRDA